MINRLEPTADLNDPRTRFALNETLDLVSRELSRLKAEMAGVTDRETAVKDQGERSSTWVPEITWSDNVSVSARFSRRGPFLEAHGTIQIEGTPGPAATVLQMYLPRGLHVDRADRPTYGLVGHVFAYDDSTLTNWSPGFVLAELAGDETDALVFYLPDAAAPQTMQQVEPAVPFTFEVTDVIEFKLEVPIREWRSA